jgi:hypothetical protein
MGARFLRRARQTVVLAMLAGTLGVAFAHAAGKTADQLTPVLAGVLAPPAAVLQSDGIWKLPY